MGREMTVTLKKIQDLQGNIIPRAIEFKKTIANLNLDEALSTFDFTLETQCDQSTIDNTSIQDMISEMLRLGDSSRVKIVDAQCQKTKTRAEVLAKVQIEPPSRSTTRRGLRDESGDTLSSTDAFYSLLELTEESKRPSRKLKQLDNLKLLATTDVRELNFRVDNMQVIPGEADTKLYSLDAKRSLEEEMILAVAEDKHSLDMMRMDHNILELDHKLDQKLSTADAHMEELDHKLDEILGHVLYHRKGGSVSEDGMAPTRHHADEDIAEILGQLHRLEQAGNHPSMISSLGYALFVFSLMLMAYARQG
jgi:flagellar biosynthesis chaperone FliJ